MQIDFSAMAVGEERKLPDGLWDTVRPIYEQCMQYVRSCPAPRPQFEFQETAKQTERSFPKWTVRRVR